MQTCRKHRYAKKRSCLRIVVINRYVNVMSEQWKPVVGYEGHYEVSDLGRVRSVDRIIETHYEDSNWGKTRKINGQLKKINFNGYYPVVRLSKNNKHCSKSVHIVVARAFLGPVPKGHVVAHGTEGRSCAKLSNLSYKTHQQNCFDRNRDGTGVKGSDHGCSVLSDEDVLKIYKKRNHGISSRFVAVEFGVSKSTVLHIWSGRNWTHVTGATPFGRAAQLATAASTDKQADKI